MQLMNMKTSLQLLEKISVGRFRSSSPGGDASRPGAVCGGHFREKWPETLYVRNADGKKRRGMTEKAPQMIFLFWERKLNLEVTYG
jgi:hypothetical protein